ncbi:progonadoliberin-1-like isoform X2 [Antennarius striatus]|uniref:progonadoliberin-1-like isoform X2 n=1 Tax=Antennarius striatus TaxID=241820 RepID=UPI0035B18CD5
MKQDSPTEKTRRRNAVNLTCLMRGPAPRMAPPSSTLALLLVALVLSQGCCQHWSFGLNPGGKRELVDAVGRMVEGLPRLATPGRAAGCAEEPPFPRMKGFLDRPADPENDRRMFE